MITKESIHQFFTEKTSRPLSFKEIAGLMDLSRPEARALKRVLREMLRSGDIVLTRKGLYGPSDEMNLIRGYFESHRDGYGFVILEKPGERDIFVPARWTAGAMNHDRVVVRVEDWRRRDGRIVRVLERAHACIAGRVDVTREAVYVRPKHKSVPFDIYIAPKDRNRAKHGDNVVVEIVTYPESKRPPSGKIIKIIEKPDSPKAEVEAIIEEFNLPVRFPRAAAEEAKFLAAVPRKAGAEPKRKDLRELPTVTIDGERAKDFDDAVSVALTEHGYRLWVHIADVGHFIPWDSALDLEARKRGTSVYFPDRVIPMLPKELSEDLCSLKPKVERFAFTAEMDFDRVGQRTGSRFYPSLIRSDERMTYTAVRKVLVDQDRHERDRYSHLIKDFELMGELCGVLRSVRMARGSLDFDLPEPEVILDLQGNPENIIRAERNFAHMIIEEFMIAANEAVASHLEGLLVPSIYRIHEEPDPMKMDDILKMVRPLGLFPRKTFRPKDFSGLLRDIRNTPAEETVNSLVLRSLKQARYSTANVGHFGLASESYSHFTSPIRRYPDLVVHRILREVLTKKHLSDRRKEELAALLPDIAFSSSRMERMSDDAEREVIDAMRVWFMKDRVGGEFEGKVTHVTPYGLRIRLKDYYVEGFLHVSFMTDDFYQYHEKTMKLVGRNTRRSFKIGQELKVRLDKIDREEREIIFGVVSGAMGA